MDEVKIDKAVTEIEKATTKLSGPIRTFFNAIGNSTVTAYSILGIALIICASIITTPSPAAERKLTAYAQYAEILNDKATGVVALGAFSPILAVTDANNMTIKFVAVKNAVKYRVVWSGINQEGMKTFTSISPDSDGNVILTLPKAEFGTDWAIDLNITVQVLASDSTGRTYSSKSKNVLVQ